MEQARTAHRIPGVQVALWRDGELQQVAAGVTNVVTGIDMTIDTVSHIGSITKLFTATLVMQLVDEGRVELDRCVVDYVPQFRVASGAATRAITVRMLLNHSSGFDGELLPDHGHDAETIEQALPRFSDFGQIHAPGTDCSYCNAGYVVAGCLAQRVAGKSWYALIRERIFAPLGMTHSVALPEEALLHRASVGHHLDNASGELHRTSFAFLPLSFSPAGSTLMMSAGDLVTFARAHLGEGLGANRARIVSAASARRMRTEVIRAKGMPNAGSRGLGWSVADNGLLSHGGGGPGILSFIYAHPEHDVVLAILTNAEHGLALIAELSADIIGAATGIDAANSGYIAAAAPPVAIALPIDPARYVGSYENLLVRYVVEASPTGGLALRSAAKFALYDSTSVELSPAMALTPMGEDVFMAELPAGSAMRAVAPIGRLPMAFVNRGADGRPAHLAASGRLYRRSD